MSELEPCEIDTMAQAAYEEHSQVTPWDSLVPHIKARWRRSIIAAWNRRATPAEVDALRAALERERMRLAACGVVAMSNTAESAARNRAVHPDYDSASLQDVASAVDREMALRARVERLEGAFGAWIEAEDALQEFERLNPNNSGRAWRRLFDARANAEDAARAALEDRNDDQ